jgi:tetratricopeptide (TPR) repeat protein
VEATFIPSGLTTVRKQRLATWIAMSILFDGAHRLPAHSETAGAQLREMAPVRTSDTILKFQPNYGTVPSKNLDDYFEFIDDSLGFTRPKTQAWTENEKQVVRHILSKILSRLPGLVIHAAAGRKIALARSTPDEKRASASTLPEGILIANGFFDARPLFRMEALVHELVHSADLGGQIAFSKSWVMFANPIISKIRTMSRLSPKKLSDEDVVKINWVSLYGTTNLGEGLAEYFPAAELGVSNFKFDPAFSKFADRLKQPTVKDLRFLDHFKNGRIFYSLNRYQDAITELEKARDLDPNAGMVPIYLGACYRHINQLERSIKEFRQALAMCREAGVPDCEPDMGHLQSNLAYALEDSKRYQEAIQLLDKLIINDGDSTNKNCDYLTRAMCHQKLGHFYESASDYYSYYKAQNQLPDFRDVDVAHYKLVLTRIDAQVRSQPTAAKSFEARAKYHEYLGDQHSEPKLKQQFYLSAMGDLERCNNCQDAEKTHVLICRAKLFVKLNDMASAKLAYSKAISINEYDLEARIFNLKLLELAGKTGEATAKFFPIVSELMGAPYSERYPEGDFVPGRFGNIG